MRRRKLRIAVAAASVLFVLVAVGAIAAAVLYQRADLDTAGKIDFSRRLKVPPLAASRIDGEGRRVFDLTARRGHTEFRAGVRTATYGLNGSYLGPTLRARRGEQVLVNVENGVGEPTTLHWHGMHLPAQMDGGPHQVIAPGATWAATWEIDQPAATLWYHPHLEGRTAEHVYRGLAGMFIVDERATAAAGLPSGYGVDDVPVIVQDRRFHDDGRLDLGAGPISPTGILGDEILVNGTLAPYLDVRSQRVRLRLLNASNARMTNSSGTPHSFHVHDVRFRVLDIDGAPPRPALSGWKDTVYLPPRRRFRLVIPFGRYADPHTPYMFHCHLLRHEDQGMMGQFVVTADHSPSSSPLTPPQRR